MALPTTKKWFAPGRGSRATLTALDGEGCSRAAARFAGAICACMAACWCLFAGARCQSSVQMWRIHAGLSKVRLIGRNALIVPGSPSKAKKAESSAAEAQTRSTHTQREAIATAICSCQSAR